MGILSKRINKTPLGIYVHVPFCRSKCQYCDFYSLSVKDDKLMDNFLDAICAHIREAGALAPTYKVDTIYFGGGTPSFFGADGIATILTTLRRSFDVDNNAEITIECNPDSVSDKLLHRLRFGQNQQPFRGIIQPVTKQRFTALLGLKKLRQRPSALGVAFTADACRLHNHKHLVILVDNRNLHGLRLCFTGVDFHFCTRNNLRIHADALPVHLDVALAEGFAQDIFRHIGQHTPGQSHQAAGPGVFRNGKRI